MRPTSNIFAPTIHTNRNKNSKNPTDEDGSYSDLKTSIGTGDCIESSSTIIKPLNKSVEEEVCLNIDVQNSLFDLVTSSSSSTFNLYSDGDGSHDDKGKNMNKRRRKLPPVSDKVIISDAAMLLSLFEI